MSRSRKKPIHRGTVQDVPQHTTQIETVGFPGWAEFVHSEDGRRVVVLPSLRLVVTQTEEGRCRIMPIESDNPDAGVEVNGNVGETADKLARAGSSYRP